MKKITHTLAFLILLLPFTACEAKDDSAQQKLPLSFDSKCCEAERAIVWKTNDLDKAVAAQGNSNIDVGIIKNDLNDDGAEDFLALISSPIYCGSSGCTFNIFINDGKGGYTQARGPSNIYPNIDISNEKKNGLKGLIIPTKDGKNCLWQWDGKSYEPGMCE